MHDHASPMLEAHRLSFELADISELPELYQAIVDKGRRRLGFDRMADRNCHPGGQGQNRGLRPVSAYRNPNQRHQWCVPRRFAPGKAGMA